MIKHFKLFSYFIHINNFIVFYDVDSFCIKNQNYENFKSNLFSLVLEKILVFESWILFSPPITLIYILYIYRDLYELINSCVCAEILQHEHASAGKTKQ